MPTPLLAAMLLFAAEPTPPRSLNGLEWISRAEYPIAALRHDKEGTVAITLAINERGKVTHCKVAKSSGVSSLDEATCRLAKAGARFAPATDATGRATAASLHQNVTWKLWPKRIPLAAWAQVSRAVIDQDGKVLLCAATSEGTVPSDLGNFCDTASKNPTLALSARGGPSASVTTTFADFRLSVDGQPSLPELHVPIGTKLVSLISARLEIADNGEITKCSTKERQRVPKNASLCETYPLKFKPILDMTGKPQRSRATLSYSFSTATATP